MPRTATTSGATAREETSPLRFALIVMGFLTVCVLAVAAVLHASRSSDAVESDPAKLKLPELVSDPLDEQLPTLLAPKADSLGIDAPGVLLVFSDGTAGPGVRAAKLAVEMHRRLRGSATRVVLVVPRETVTSEAEADDALLKDQLRGMGVIGDLPVLLDSADDGGPGHRRRTQWQMKDPIGAILLRDGVEWMRVTPPTSSDGLVRENLAALVKAAASVPPR